MVNHKENQWVWNGKRYDLKPGQMITSVKKICLADGNATSQNVRTALAKFKALGFLTIESTKQNSLISVINWDSYQGLENEINEPANKQLTNDQQTTNKQLTTKKERKKERKKEENKKTDKKETVFASQVMEIFRQLTGRNFRTNESNCNPIMSRAKDFPGLGLEDFKLVIECKIDEWGRCQEMKKHLAPQTVFRASNFERYLIQAEEWKKSGKPDQFNAKRENSFQKKQNQLPEATRKQLESNFKPQPIPDYRLN